MAFSLKKWLEEATATINPFDGGKTAATVRASRPAPPPAQTRPAPQAPSYGTGLGGVFNRVRDTFDANTPQDQWKRQQQQQAWRAPMQMPKPVDTRNLWERTFDQANIFDNNRTFKQADPTQTKSAFQQGGQFGGQVVRGTIGGTARVANTIGAQGAQVIPTAQMLMAQATGNTEAWRNANAVAQAADENFKRNEGGLLNTGTLYNTEEARRGDLKTGATRIGGGIAESGLEVASLGLGGFTGKQVAKQGLRQGIKSQVPIIAKNALLNTAQGGVMAANQGAQAGDIAKSAALSGALGTVGDVGLGVAGAGIAKAASNIPPSRLVSNVQKLATDEGGFIQPGRTPKRVHPEDQNVMADFIDYQRGVYKPDPDTAYNLELDASRIAERYGLEMPNSAPKLANVFDKRLQQEKFAAPKLTTRLVKNTKAMLGDEQGAIGRNIRDEGGEAVSPTSKPRDLQPQEPQTGLDQISATPTQRPQTPKNQLEFEKTLQLSGILPNRANQPSGNILPDAPTARASQPRTQADTSRPFDVNDTTDFNSKQYVKQMTKAQELARKEGAPTGIQKVSAAKAKFKTKAIDRFAPIEDTLRKAQKAGAKIDTDKNVSYQLDRVLRSEGIAQAYVKDKGLAKVIQTVKNTDEFDQYLIAKHAKELGDEVATGRNKAKDAALVESLSGKYEAKAKELYKYNQELLDKSVEYDLISPQQAAQLKKQYPEYVPFNRIFPDDDMPQMPGKGGEASIGKQTVVQKIKGSQRQIESPLGSIIQKTQAVIEQGERNKAASLLASYKDLPGNPFQLKEIPASEAIGSRHTISFIDKGKKRTFETTKEISEAAKHLNREQINVVGRVIAAPARVLRLGATGVNVPFVVSNVVKDIVGSFVNSKNALSSSPANLPALGKALAAALKHDGKYYQELMREGVAGTSFDIMRDAAKLNVREIRSHRNPFARSLEAAKPKNWLSGMENTIGRSEDFGRALQYYGNKSAYLRKNIPEAEATILAADQARFNSTNFARMGEYGRAINSVVPYSNAAVQGARIGVRRIKERPVQTITKMGLTIAAPSAIVAANNYKDEKRRKIMDNIPEYEKENNIIIVGDDTYQDDAGNWHNVKKIPVPPQFIGIHNSIQRLVESKITGKDYDTGKSVGDIAENYTTVNPTNLRKTANNYLPQGAKLIAEPMVNRNFFTGQQIVPDALKNLDAEDQVNKGTSGTAKVLGKLTNTSPLQIDNTIRTGLAGAGQNLVNLIDRQVLAKTGQISEDEIRGKGIGEAIKGRFGEVRGRSQGALYYQTMEQAAKELKLGGKDYQQLNALLAKSIDADGNPKGKTEKEKRAVHDILQAHPRIIEVRSKAAKDLSKLTGKPYDPLYDLPTEQQEVYHRIQSVPKNSADARDLKERNKKWLEPFMDKRSKYFEENPIAKKAENDLVEFPNVDKKTQQLVDQYFTIKDPAQRAAMIDSNPAIGEYFNMTAKYANDVRKEQGFNPMRTYQQPSSRVQALMDAGNFKDPEVSQWLQNNSIYNLTKDGALAQIQGNDLSSKALKAANSLGRYNLVKNPDGTYALKYGDTQGSGQSGIQPGAEALGAFGSGTSRSGGRSGRRGGRSGRGGSRSAKGKFDYKLDGFGKKQSSLRDDLLKLVEQAGGKSKVKIKKAKNIG